MPKGFPMPEMFSKNYYFFDLKPSDHLSDLKDRLIDALSSVYANYLIVGLSNGKQYVGSAYGSGGLLERWRCYVETCHGGNKGVKEVLSNESQKENFQFSILQILPKTITGYEVIGIENLYKVSLEAGNLE